MLTPIRSLSAVVNDWMVGLVPLIMTSHYRRHGCYENARTVFDIHNMGYCGNFPVSALISRAKCPYFPGKVPFFPGKSALIPGKSAPFSRETFCNFVGNALCIYTHI
jgi:hypothetical protein